MFIIKVNKKKIYMALCETVIAPTPNNLLSHP